MPDDDNLDRAAALAKLVTISLGRVAWAAEDGRVVVEPVNFAVDGEYVVFRTGEGDKLDAVRQGCSFSFEADDVEQALRVGWSVVVSGSTEEVTEPDERRRLEELALSPWDVSSPKRHLVRIRAEHVTGRRLPLHPGGVTFVRSAPE